MTRIAETRRLSCRSPTTCLSTPPPPPPVSPGSSASSGPSTMRLKPLPCCTASLCQRENGGELSVVDGDVKPEALGPLGSLDDYRLKLGEELAKLGDDLGCEDMPVEEFAAAYVGVMDGKRGKCWGRAPRRMFQLDARLLCFLNCKFSHFFCLVFSNLQTSDTSNP
ncbi:hypothetical protein BT93_G1589 [Corymbia citriodora subsp. variegata]|nr:hypothetical protein BT93_G1589 [Corymbia citriodora subsp. variegata]